MLKIGQKAPDFELSDADGARFRLSDAKGQLVVLYFYPQDDTETCNVENAEFSEFAAAFAEAGVQLFGISPDSVESHRKFRDKYGLNARLLSDPDHDAIGPYRTWGPKKLYGRDYMGLIRTTYLVGQNGRIAGAWKVTRVRGHAEKVLAAARKIAAASP
ncbi:MAG: peroxiredoxin [Hyphomicrobiaceae bacterium]|nr:peroxiredoxin [Hyphomicrobiaceae bacterium]